MKFTNIKKRKSLREIIVASFLCICCCVTFTLGGGTLKTRATATKQQTATTNQPESFGEGLSERLYDMSSRYDGKRGQTYGSDTLISNTDSGLPNAPILGNGNVGLVLGGSAVGQSLNVGMNDFWQGTYNSDDISGIEPLPVGSLGFNVLSEHTTAVTDIDLAPLHSRVTASGVHADLTPEIAVSGDYVSTARRGMWWETPRGASGDGAWLKLEFAQPIEFQRFVIWNASSSMYSAFNDSQGEGSWFRPKNPNYNRTANIQDWNTYAFKIQISNNNTDWTDVFTETENYQAIYDRDLAEKKTAKYVRLQIDKASSSAVTNSAKICKFSLFGSPKNDPNLMPLLVNGGTPGEGIAVTSSTISGDSGDTIYTSSDLYLTVSGTVQHLAGYGTAGCGWYSGSSAPASITYKLNKATDFKSYQIFNGSASAPNQYGRGDWRAWTVETSQDDGATWNEIHKIDAPTDPSAPNWGGQPAVSSFDIASDKLSYTTNVNKIRLTVKSTQGSRALLSQFKIFADILENSGIDQSNRAMFYQNIRDGKVGTDSSYNGQAYIADTFMSQEDTNGKNYVVTKFTNNSSKPLTFKYYTSAHRYKAPESCQTAGVENNGKSLFSTYTTKTADPSALAWVSAATIAASLEGGAAWANTQVVRGAAYGEFTVPANSSQSVIAYVDGRQYNSKSTGVKYNEITAANSPTKQAALSLSLTGDSSAIEAQSTQWWKEFWLKSYVDISSADAAAEKYYYFAMYIVGCSTRQDNVPVSLFGPFITSNTPAWAGVYTTDYNMYGPYMAVAASNRTDLLKPLVRNALEAWGGSGLGNGIGQEYGEKLNDLRLAKFKNSDGSWMFKNGVDGILSCVRSGPHGYAIDNDGFYGIFFTSAYAAIPVLSYFDMTQGSDPMLTKQIEYDYLKDMMALWEQILFYENGEYRVKFDAAWEDELNQTSNAFTIAAMTRFTARLIEGAEILGITVEQEPRLSKWMDINKNIEAPPSAMTADSNGVKRLSYSDTKESASQGYVTVKGLSYNNPNVVTAKVFPVGDLGMFSDPAQKLLMQNSLTTMRSWGQMNAHPTIFSVAAKMGYAEYNQAADTTGFEVFEGKQITTLLGQYSKTSSQNMAANNISGLFDPLQLIDTCGGAQGLHDMLAQIHKNVIKLFPAFPKDKDAKFVNLQLTGGILVSANYNGTTKKVAKAQLTHKFGGKINIAVPAGVKWKIVDSKGNDVAITTSVVGSIVGIDAYNNIAAISFNAVKGSTYNIVEVLGV